MPFILSSDTDDQGEWFLYGKDTDGKDIRFKVRRLSSSKEYEIERLYTPKKTELQYRKGNMIIQQDPDVARAGNIDKASYALLDSENCAVVPPDRETAGMLAKALGSDEPVIGKPLLLDGKWGRVDDAASPRKLSDRYPVKGLFFSDYMDVALRVITKAKKLGIQALEEEEEGKAVSSPS